MNNSKNKFISLIIATKDEEKYINRLLDSIVNQTYPKNKFEILIFDGLSKDKTIEIIENYKKKLNIKLFKNKKIKHVFAFNEGIKKSKGDYFMIIGAHSILDKNFIKKGYETFVNIKKKEKYLAGVGGSLKNIYENKISKLIASMWSSPFSGGSSFRYSKKPSYRKTVVFAIYDKKIIKKIGLFNKKFIVGQDFELNLRLNKKKYKLYQNPQIKVKYFVRNSFKKFIIQNFNYGAVKGMCIRKNYFNPIWFIPFLFLIYEIILLFIIKTNIFIWFTIPFITYLFINMLVSFQLFIKFKGGYSLLLPLLFFISHNILAMGFIKGLLLGEKTFKIK